MRIFIANICCFLFFACTKADAQKIPDSNSVYHVIIPDIRDRIVIDGLINEQIWQLLTPYSHFKRQFPNDTSYAAAQTIVYVYSDDDNLYIAAVCYDTTRKHFVVESLKRDFAFASNDNFSVILDPYHGSQNGFVFSITPFGVLREGQIINGGSSASNDIWDQKWLAAVKRFDDKWTIEVSIPFSILRVKNGTDNWGINFVRNNVKLNEVSSWVPVPISQPYTKLGFTGILKWEKRPAFPKPRFFFYSLRRI